MNIGNETTILSDNNTNSNTVSIMHMDRQRPLLLSSHQIIMPRVTFGRNVNVHDRVSAIIQSALVSSSDQGAVATKSLNLEVFANQIPPILKFSGEVDN